MMHTDRTLIAWVLATLFLTACRPIQAAEIGQELTLAPVVATSALSLDDATVGEIERW